MGHEVQEYLYGPWRETVHLCPGLKVSNNNIYTPNRSQRTFRVARRPNRGSVAQGPRERQALGARLGMMAGLVEKGIGFLCLRVCATVKSQPESMLELGEK